MTEDLLRCLSNDWIIQCTPSGYMDRDGWLKVISQFEKLYGASPINNQIIHFDGHNSHWDPDAFDMLA